MTSGTAAARIVALDLAAIHACSLYKLDLLLFIADNVGAETRTSEKQKAYSAFAPGRMRQVSVSDRSLSCLV
jgi:hypothetical protein